MYTYIHTIIIVTLEYNVIVCGTMHLIPQSNVPVETVHH